MLSIPPLPSLQVQLSLFVNIWCVWYCISVWFIIFSGLFLVFQGHKTNLLLILLLILILSWLGPRVLACLETCAFLPGLYHYFLISSYCRVAPKIAGQGKLVVFPSPCFVIKSLIRVVPWIGVRVPEKRTTFAGLPSGLPCWLSRQCLPIMTLGLVVCVPRCVILWFDIFIIGGILWLYQTEGSFKIYAPDRGLQWENS